MATYTRRETTGAIEQLNPRGIKLDGVWWDVSQRTPVNLAGLAVGQVVYVEASETADGARRFINLIEPAQGGQNGSRPAPAYVDDLPDELPDSLDPQTRPAAQPGVPRELVADRLACLQIASHVLAPWWVKKAADPDGALLIGLADQLVGYLHRR